MYNHDDNDDNEIEDMQCMRRSLMTAVNDIAEPPYFRVRPSTFYQRQPGQSVVMPCVADGEPHPTISWKKVLHRRVLCRYLLQV